MDENELILDGLGPGLADGMSRESSSILGCSRGMSGARSNLDAGMMDMESDAGDLNSGYYFITELRQTLGDFREINVARGQIWNALCAMMAMTGGLMAIYRAARSFIDARIAEETAIVAGEVTAHAAAQDWGGIALAASAATIVGGAFAGGFLGGYELSVQNVNIDNPEGRRKAQSALQGARAGVY